MKKLALNIEELKVDSFSTDETTPQRGTVRARESFFTWGQDRISCASVDYWCMGSNLPTYSCETCVGDCTNATCQTCWTCEGDTCGDACTNIIT